MKTWHSKNYVINLGPYEGLYQLTNLQYLTLLCRTLAYCFITNWHCIIPRSAYACGHLLSNHIVPFVAWKLDCVTLSENFSVPRNSDAVSRMIESGHVTSFRFHGWNNLHNLNLAIWKSHKWSAIITSYFLHIPYSTHYNITNTKWPRLLSIHIFSITNVVHDWYPSNVAPQFGGPRFILNYIT